MQTFIASFPMNVVGVADLTIRQLWRIQTPVGARRARAIHGAARSNYNPSAAVALDQRVRKATH